jgi:hypothetical protein
MLGVVDLIRLAQDRDQWRAIVSAVMSHRVLAPRSDLPWCEQKRGVSGCVY